MTTRTASATTDPNTIRLKFASLAGLFLVVILALLLGRSVDISWSDVKIDIGASLEDTRRATKEKEASERNDAKSVPQPDLNQDESKKLLAENGLSEDKVKSLLVGTSQYLPKATILWVDDNPPNNQLQHHALASLGIFCDEVTNHSDARRAASMTKYDIIISDFMRDHESEDGLDLLREVRQDPAYHDTPFFFYSTEADTLPTLAAQRNISMTNVVATYYPSVLLTSVLTSIPHPLPKDESRLSAYLRRMIGKQ